MRWILAFLLLIGIGAVSLRLFNSMSNDALAMAIGFLFGMLASLPVALLVLVVQRSQMRGRQPEYREPRQPREYGGSRPMVIMMPNGQQQTQQAQQQPHWSVTQGPPPPRLLSSTKIEDSDSPGNFRVIGDDGAEW